MRKRVNKMWRCGSSSPRMAARSGDNFVISTASSRRRTAEAYLDSLLRPEVSARIVNENRYANANEAALPLVDPAIRNDPVSYPPPAQLHNAHFRPPLSEEGEQRYRAIWARFMGTPAAKQPDRSILLLRAAGVGSPELAVACWVGWPPCFPGP